MEPDKKSAWAARGGRRRDRKVLRKAQIRTSAATEISAPPTEVRRHDAADDLGVHAVVGLAVRAGFRPAVVRA